MPDNEVTPEPIRFFGTRWVERGPGYWLRRVGVSTGALAAAGAGTLLMRLGVQGVLVSRAGPLVDALLVVAVAVCTCGAAIRTWSLFDRGRAALTGWMADDRTVGPMLVIGCVGMLVAYLLRSLIEAPGEGERRVRYERAVAARARRRTPVAAGGRRKRR
ncbi:hypothetical protein [Streptacidiphilus cavernicola]|uniref:DUF202 domain-containing protein n=1 Tax=Streptacidiphilus cavernicola TaxID=3342716 RepID=A0ABV6VX48_9ACTN